MNNATGLFNSVLCHAFYMFHRSNHLPAAELQFYSTVSLRPVSLSICAAVTTTCRQPAYRSAGLYISVIGCQAEQ